MHRLRAHGHSPALVISVVALIVAMCGTGYAAFHLAKNSVGTRQIKNGAVKASKIGAQAVVSSGLSDGAVTGSKLAPNSVTGAAVADGSLTAADIQTSTLPGQISPPQGQTSTTPGAFRSFAAVLGPNATKALTVGDFTFTETADGTGACTDVTLTAGAKDAKVAVNHELVAAVMANKTVTIITAPGGSTTNLMATADGSENIYVTVAAWQTAANTKCLTFGGVAPIP
jgi:hypothetical protein